MNSAETMVAIVKYNLKLEPILSPDGQAFWTCSSVKHHNASGKTIHYVYRHPSPVSAVAEWLKFYSDTPTHGLVPGAVAKCSMVLTATSYEGCCEILQVGTLTAVVVFQETGTYVDFELIRFQKHAAVEVNLCNLQRVQ